MKELKLTFNKVDDDGCLDKLYKGESPTLFSAICAVNNLNDANKEFSKMHGIEFKYKKISLAISNPDYKKEFKVWNKYITTMQDKQAIIERGYFFVVDEIELC